MPDRSDISPLSITDGKISKGAKIDPTKLAPATSGQVLIAGTDGKFRPGNLVTTSSGDTVAQGPAGATGATGSQGATGITGATGSAGVDGTDATVTATTVNAAGAIMHTDVPDSDTGFVKRTGAETYDVDTATYSTTGHTHDDRYYTETEADALLATKSATTHTHDGRYYTETETDTLLATKAGTGHTHDDRYYTETEADTLLATKAASSHTHDDRYYTETEADTLLATKAASSHNHSGTDITSGTIDTDRLDVGASSGKVAAGDHAHASYITGNQSITLSGDVTGSGTTAITCVVADNSHSHSTATLTGLGGAAEKDVGTGSGDVAQGNHTHAAGTTSAAGFISTTDKTKLDACLEVDDAGGSTTSNTWSASKIASNALYVAANYSPVKAFKISIDWGNSTQTGVDYPVGTDPTYDGIVDITHGLATNYVVCSVVDNEGKVKTANTQFDMNFESEVLVNIVSTNKIRLTFAHISSATASENLEEGDQLDVTIIGVP